MSKLTIGMCVYDDFDGVYFTIQSLRLYHSDVIKDIEFIVIDNNPSSSHGSSIKQFVESIPNSRYIEFTDYTSTSLRNLVFEYANTPYVLCVDCHVLLIPDSIKKLIEYFETEDNGDLLHGPLNWDRLDSVSTHFNNNWGAHMHGQWDKDSKYRSIYSAPFDIHAQGLGLFACRKDSWLGFNPNFRGFGGEEVYIHEKYRQHGKRVILLPFLGWVHRFTRPHGVPYRNTYEDRYRNYIIGRLELGTDTDEIDDIFSDVLSEDTRENIKDEIVTLFQRPTQQQCRCKCRG